MRKTRSQTQAENGPSASTRSFARSAAPGTKTTSSSSSTREKDHDKTDNPFTASNPPPPTNQSNRQASELDPAKLKEYQDMIQTFRVVDLHKVLQFLSLSVAGRKHELQQRVLDLLKTNFELVSTKLREIYRTDYYSERNVQYGPPDPKRMFSHMQMPTVQSTADVRSAMVSVGNVGNTGVGPNAGNGGGAVPANMGVPFQHNIGASMPIHPDVRLKKLAFYDVLATLIKPSSLLPRSNQRIQELPFYFTLTPQQATEIATNRDIRNGSKVEHSIQVQLRFCLLETSCEQEDCFPSNVIVKVNNKLCPLPNPIPTNRPNVEPKRPPRPVNVTSNVKLSPTVTNTITVQWCPDFSRGYCIAAYLVKKLTSSQLLHRMKTKGIKPADYTRGLIKEKLTEDADCEIATTMLKVSLNCPLGKMKMSIPCRASTCSHLQCFDANLYLQMNERKPTWNCPVCDKPAIYDHLVIDGYFQEVLASSLLGSEDTEIQLHKDGSWSTHNLRNETQLIDTPSKPVEKVELISDDIELITDDVKPLTKAPPPPVISNEPTSTTNSETVDLTLSDSDDDMPLAKRKTATSKNAAASAAVSTSNGQRSATVQSSQTSKGALEGSLIHEEQSLKPVCDISNKIRQYLKTCHIPSIIPLLPPPQAVEPVAKDINHTKITPKTTPSPTMAARSEEDQSNIISTNQEGYSIADQSIALNYYSRGTDSIDINSTQDQDESFSEVSSKPCLNNEPISGILLPQSHLKKSKKHKSKRRSNSVQSTKDPSVVPFERILETFGPDGDKSNISKQERLRLRKMWAIENRLQGTASSALSTLPITKPISKATLTSNWVQGYCPPPSTRSQAMDMPLSPSPVVESSDMGLPAHISSSTLAISQFWDTPFLPTQGPIVSSPQPSAQSHIMHGASQAIDDSHMSPPPQANSARQTDKTANVRNNKYRKLLSRLNKMHKILSDPPKTRDYDPKTGRRIRASRSLPPGVNVHELLEFATINIDSLNKLSTETKMQFKTNQPYARELLQRCKHWRNRPQKLMEAFQKGLI